MTPEDRASRIMAECLAQNRGKNIAFYLTKAIKEDREDMRAGISKSALLIAAKAIDAAMISHVDGRDLLEELDVTGWHFCNIHVRKNGKRHIYEGDWLKDVWYARKTMQAAVKTEAA